MIRNQTILAFALLLGCSAPVLAEIDLSGSWASINHEDALERGAGPAEPGAGAIRRAFHDP